MACGHNSVLRDDDGQWYLLYHARFDDGTEYQEYTLVIYLSDTTEEAVHEAADELIATFNQSSVLIQANPTTTEFYSPAQ